MAWLRPIGERRIRRRLVGMQMVRNRIAQLSQRLCLLRLALFVTQCLARWEYEGMRGWAK